MNDIDPESGNSSNEIPAIWVNDYIEVEGTIHDLLDDILRAQVSADSNNVKEMIRSLYKNRHGAFQTVLLSLGGNPQFFDDVEEQLGTETKDKLTDIRGRYSSLEDDFRIIQQEENNGRINPIKSYSTYGNYEYNSDIPLVGLQLKSGSFAFPTIEDRPHRMIQLAVAAIDATNDVFEYTLDEEHNLPEDEIEDINSALSELNDQLEELQDYTDLEENND
ncbi:hypothetical protein [Haloarcula argentinensis]|uniref:Uncharacterized protein n=1 Tax=Haloarcula argentinensis TaxID=43776 RepID=A0A830FT40_HALAR|nr:hypothetical protein [Haloarcula argentinensis]GGM37242.1 hypothetical protein GCM10009006_17990 [Haloarcula argentinensis]